MTRNHFQPAATIMSARPARGVTLVEVLVTMVLVGVGMLGLAGMQARGMQVNQGSSYRAQSANLAVDLADRMRADPAAAAAGSYDGIYSPMAPAPNNAAVLPLLQDWLFQMRSIPGASATVVTAGPAVRITVSWDDTRAANAVLSGAGPSAGSFVLTTELSD
jgi:type IV pilus assembly protein PilV